jgi:hypothetical protein
MKQYIGGILEACSQFVNAMLGGYSDEMLSARAWRVQCVWLVAVLDIVLGHGHCERMYRWEFERKSQHPHYGSDS